MEAAAHLVVLDPAAFTHPKSIGTAVGRALGRTPDDGFRMDWRIATKAADAAPDEGGMAFHPPNAMSLGIPQKKPGRVSLLIL